MIQYSDRMRWITAALFVFCIAAGSVSAQEEWALHRATSTAELRETADEMVQRGLTPVGLDYHDERGLTMLFTNTPWWPAGAYRIEDIGELDKLTQVVTERIREGWLPMDLSLQDGRYIVLFADVPERVAGWRVIGSEPSLMEIQSTISTYRSEGFTTVGLSRVDDARVAHLFLALPERDFPLPTVVGIPRDAQEAAATIQSMVDDGWFPVGVTTTDEEIILAFLRAQ